jgi:hypothetical protein
MDPGFTYMFLLSWRSSATNRPFKSSVPELEFLKRLWGLGTGEEEGYRTGPPGYIGWRNSFLGIDSGAQYMFKNTSSAEPNLLLSFLPPPLSISCVFLSLSLIHMTDMYGAEQCQCPTVHAIPVKCFANFLANSCVNSTDYTR